LPIWVRVRKYSDYSKERWQGRINALGRIYDLHVRKDLEQRILTSPHPFS
jgi:hypothetical protein